MSEETKRTWKLDPITARARRAAIPEPVDYAKLQRVQLVGPYTIALFTKRQARIFCAPRVGVNRGPIELRLRQIEGTLTVRLSLGELAKRRRTRTKSQITSTVSKQIAAMLGPFEGHTLVSLDGTCSVRSLWWVPSISASVVTRWARSQVRQDESAFASLVDSMKALHGVPVVLPKLIREAVTVNDQIGQA